MRKRHITGLIGLFVLIVATAVATAPTAKPAYGRRKLPVLTKAENMRAEIRDSPHASVTAVSQNIPVLMYHSINYEKGNTLRVPANKFEAQMQWLKQNGYNTLTLDELYAHTQNKTLFPAKSVVLTFDDGYSDNYDAAFPILKKYGFKATVFMISGKIDDTRNGYLTRSQLTEMDRGGMCIQCHTVSHPNLANLSGAAQTAELRDSKAALERLLGHSVDYLAFPCGKYNTETLRIARELGFKLCFRMNGGKGTPNSNPMLFPRVFIGADLGAFSNRLV